MMRAFHRLLPVFAVTAALPLTAQHVRTLESSRLFADSAPVSVRLALGTGTLTVGAADAPYLYRSISRFGDAFAAPRSQWNAAQRTLTFAAGGRVTGDVREDAGQDNDAPQDWRIQLTKRAPLELAIDATAADAALDLTALPLRRFSLRSGAAAATVRFDAPNPESMSVFEAAVGAGGLKLIGVGNASASEMRLEGRVGDIAIDLGGRWTRDMQIDVYTMVGGVTITAPPSLGVELVTTGLFTRTSVVGSFEEDDRTWRSPNFQQASVKVRIAVRSLLGKVQLIQR